MQHTTRTNGSDDQNVWKGLAAGLIGGLVASWTMNRFQDVWFKVAKGIETSPGSQFQNAGGEQAAGVQDSVVNSKPEVPDDTTVERRPQFQRDCLVTS